MSDAAPATAPAAAPAAISAAERARLEKKVREAIEQLAQLNLATVAALLRVATIRLDEQTPTACLALLPDGTHEIRLGTHFLQRFGGRAQIAGLLFHELLHHTMRHLERPAFDDPQLANLVFDAFINRTIHATDPSLSRLMRDFYDRHEGPECFLRPGAKPRDWIDAQHYRALYQGKLTEQDLADHLRRRHEAASGQVELLGDHSGGAGGRGQNPIPVEQVPEIVEDVAGAIEQRRGGGKLAGRLRGLAEEFIRVHRLGRDPGVEEAFRLSLADALRAQVVRAVSDDAKLWATGAVLPWETIARSDAIRVGLGLDPLFWQHPRPDEQQGDVAVYVDVSGSLIGYREWLFGAILAFEEYLRPEVYEFSNEVAKISLADFRRGKLVSTYGTDFDCVAESILTEGHERALLVTDGYASMSDANREALERKGVHVFTLLTPDSSEQAVSEFSRRIFRLHRLEG